MARGTVILAEDDATLRQIYEAALTQRGFRVFAVDDGAAVLALLPRLRPRLIVLDVMMPQLNGVETCRRARTYVGDSVPILFLTASNAVETLNDCMAAGGSDFLLKSERMDNLLARIELWSLRAGSGEGWRRLREPSEAVEARAPAPAAVAFPKSDNLGIAVRKVVEIGRRSLGVTPPPAAMTEPQRLHVLGLVYRLALDVAGRDATLAVNIGDVVLSSLAQLTLLPNPEVARLIAAWPATVGEAAFIGGEDAAATVLSAWRGQAAGEPTARPS